MMRDLIRVLFCMAIAATTSPAVAEVSLTDEAETKLVAAVHLGGGFEGRDFAVLTPVGTPVVITDHHKGTKLQLIATLQPIPDNAPKQVALQIVEVLDNGSASLLDVLLLVEGGGPSLSLHVGLEIELVEVGSLEVPAGPSQGGDLRPRECCLTCGGMTTCGFCVYTSCGNCCPG